MLINNIFRSENLDIIAGPCVIESEDHALFMSEKLNSICKKLKVNLFIKVLLIRQIELLKSLLEA